MLSANTPVHPSGEHDARPAVGASDRALAHRPIPGRLLGYCGKPLDARRASTRRGCVNCIRLSTALEIFQRRVGELLLPL
ncbi:hypothetical protein OG427_07010 [Streptomyces sp. NBC_00133]|uniref:hypothetical protein n=1 Tax=Streptomyces sp. NBC_00133 TaxID=2903624 RepID=UPI003246F14B